MTRPGWHEHAARSYVPGLDAPPPVGVIPLREAPSGPAQPDAIPYKKTLSDRVQCGWGCNIYEHFDPSGGSWLGHRAFDLELNYPEVEAWFDYENDPHAITLAYNWLLDICPLNDEAERLS